MSVGTVSSLVVSFTMLIGIIVFVAVPMERKLIRKANRKIDFKQTAVYFRWNRFDTLTVGLAAYAYFCVVGLFLLVTTGKTFENNYVRFFATQAQTWVLITFLYFISRVSLTLKGIKERWPDDTE